MGMYVMDEDKGLKAMLPLQAVEIDANIRAGFAVVDLNLEYKNPSRDGSLELTFELPIEKTIVLSKLVATVNGKTIEAQVRSKEKAIERYDDAMAAGNSAVLAARAPANREIMAIKLGNLLPEQVAQLQLRLIMKLSFVLGSFSFELPKSFYPDYRSHGAAARSYKYSFKYRVSLSASSSIDTLSVPQGSEVEIKNESKTEIEFHGNERCS